MRTGTAAYNRRYESSVCSKWSSCEWTSTAEQTLHNAAKHDCRNLTRYKLLYCPSLLNHIKNAEWRLKLGRAIAGHVLQGMAPTKSTPKGNDEAEVLDNSKCVYISKWKWQEYFRHHLDIVTLQCIDLAKAYYWTYLHWLFLTLIWYAKLSSGLYIS